MRLITSMWSLIGLVMHWFKILIWKLIYDQNHLFSIGCALDEECSYISTYWVNLPNHAWGGCLSPYRNFLILHSLLVFLFLFCNLSVISIYTFSLRSPLRSIFLLWSWCRAKLKLCWAHRRERKFLGSQYYTSLYIYSWTYLYIWL